MFAPRRRPPCRITPVAVSKISRKETGPEATPGLSRTQSPAGRRREKQKPVPPPDWWIAAVRLASSTGSTKQAASWPRGMPAFIKAGLFGMNSRRESTSKKRSATSAGWPPSPPKSASAAATAVATRWHRPSKSSIRRPAASRWR
jgi:hypothetical protein